MSERKVVDEVIDALQDAHDRIDSLVAQNKQLEAIISELKQECQSLSDENLERWKSESIYREFLVGIAGQMAVDTIIQRTHRERNGVCRAIVRSINVLLKSENDKSDMDDIPF